MVTKSPTPNLLSKFGQLFRKSANDAADSEAPSQALAQDYLLHKVRDDAARAAELNQLRNAIRDSQGIKPQQANDVSALASTRARSSGLGALERRAIIRKIDSAQTHLEQWWDPGSAHAALGLVPEATAATPGGDDLDLDFTGLMDLPADARPATPTPAVFPPTAPAAGPAPAATPPQSPLCEAARLYAEGKLLAAENMLKTLLTDASLDPEESENLSFALFDVYRCAGQQERFEALALDYANRCGRSPAEWFSLSESSTTTPDTQPQQSCWQCPALLDAQALDELAAHASGQAAVCAIDWQQLQQIERSSAAALGRLIGQWCESPVALRWLGTGSLMAALQRCTSKANADADAAENQSCCLIQLDVLCILQQVQAFEELALEYCVAFEVSPPSWKTVKCTLVTEHAAQPARDFAATMPGAATDTAAESRAPYAHFELSGNITGNSPQALRDLREISRTANLVTVSCAHMGRVDPLAAQELLNWVQLCESQHCAVQFRSLPRLVLCYFHMLGMEKWASLSTGAH